MAIRVTGAGGSSDTSGRALAKGVVAHAEGYQTSAASGGYSHVEGVASSASGYCSHAEGGGTTAADNYTHAEGEGTSAAVYAGHAEGSNTSTTALYAHAEGRYALASRIAQHSKASGRFAATGDAQLANFVAWRSTTDATASILSFDGSGTVAAVGSSTNVLTLAIKTVYKFRIEVTARRTDTEGTVAGWTIEGVIARETGGNARIVGSNITTKWADTGAATWTVTCTADTTNQCLAITVTGEAAKTIRWVAALYTVEVG